LRSRWLLINRDVKILVFSLFLWEIGLTLYDSLLPIHLRRLGASPEQVGLVFSLAYLIVAISSIPGGWLADRFDRRRVMLFFWIIGAPSVLIMATAQNWFQTLPGIALYFFSFMTFPAINAYVTDASEKSQLSIAFALLYATFPAAQLVGPGLGGYLADLYGIQVVFLVSFACYAISTGVLFLLAPQHSRGAGFRPVEVLKLFANRQFRTFALLAGVIYLFFTAMLRFTSPYLEEVYGLSLFTIGLLNSIAAVGGMLLTPFLGMLGDRFNRLTTLSIGMLIFSLSLWAIGQFPSLPILIVAFLLQGCFIAGRSLMDSVIANLGKGQAAGLYFGAFGLLAGLGQTIAPILGGMLYSRTPQGAFSIIAALGLILAFSVYAFRKRYAT
jgi:MFS family permease